jgi:hypothetical protein
MLRWGVWFNLFPLPDEHSLRQSIPVCVTTTVTLFNDSG